MKATSGAVALMLVLAAADGRAQTAAEAKAFVDDADARLLKAAIEASRADWVKSTYITDDTEYLAGVANQRISSMQAELAKAATRFDKVDVPDDVRRRLLMLKLAIVLPVPSVTAEAEELAQIVASMEGTYGKGKYCPPGAAADKCQDIGRLSQVLARAATRRRCARPGPAGTRSRVPSARTSSATSSSATRARASWASPTWARSGARSTTCRRRLREGGRPLYEQVRPLYASLHAYVRRKLREQYGASVVPEKGPIPAHLLGNMWAQEWENIYRWWRPPSADPGIDLTRASRRRVRPEEDGAVAARASSPRSASRRCRDVLGALALHQAAGPRRGLPRERLGHRPGDDLRIKMCIEITARTSGRSTTSSATTTTSAPTTSSRSSSATAPTTASTRRSATPSRSR
jgi:peptidyl-dipeptidase A